MRKINWFLLIGCILLCEAAGIIGSFFTFSAIPTWYQTLDKPFFTPPNFIFGPVWTLLYALMGVAFYMVSVSPVKNKQYAIRIFFVQLVLNTFWSIIFFGLKNPGLAFVEIVIMWITIFLTIRSFRKISTGASYLLYPYLLWVTYASVLNLAIWVLNA